MRRIPRTVERFSMPTTLSERLRREASLSGRTMSRIVCDALMPALVKAETERRRAERILPGQAELFTEKEA